MIGGEGLEALGRGLVLARGVDAPRGLIARLDLEGLIGGLLAVLDGEIEDRRRRAAVALLEDRRAFDEQDLAQIGVAKRELLAALDHAVGSLDRGGVVA